MTEKDEAMLRKLTLETTIKAVAWDDVVDAVEKLRSEIKIRRKVVGRIVMASFVIAFCMFGLYHAFFTRPTITGLEEQVKQIQINTDRIQRLEQKGVK